MVLEVSALIDGVVNDFDSESDSKFYERVYDHTFEPEKAEQSCQDMNEEVTTDAIPTQPKKSQEAKATTSKATKSTHVNTFSHKVYMVIEFESECSCQKTNNFHIAMFGLSNFYTSYSQ